jgi:prepilin-type N-terminal cleavage/methylation domain-containing protein
MRSRGFTLVELLVVIGVIAVLTALSFPAISAVRRKSQVNETTATLERIKLALATYQNDFGDYPPSSGRRLGLRLNGQNDGAELMLRCLSTRARSGPYVQLDDRLLGNTDDDRLPSDQDPTQSTFGTRDLLEPLDAWQNPVVYVHNADYDAGGAAVLQQGGLTPVPAGKSPETRQYYGLTTFQLWSAGPDGAAGTDDDIRLWGE